MEKIEREDLLFYEPYTHRYFRMTMEEFQNANEQANWILRQCGDIRLGCVHSILGLDLSDSPIEWLLGWMGRKTHRCKHPTKIIDFNYTKVTLEDGMECRIIQFYPEPIA